MSKSFSLNQLTEGIRQRHLSRQNVRLVEKWSRTGLLRGIDGVSRENMARLLENQAGQVLREANSLSTGAGLGTSSGDIRGFSNIAFPIVRRVFGGLVANEIVSIQPMSLPSGLLFYLDYTYGTSTGGDRAGGNSATYVSGSSIYNNPAGKGVRSGSLGTGGQYDLAGSGYSRVHKSQTLVNLGGTGTSCIRGSGGYGTGTTLTAGQALMATGSDAKLLQFDPQLTALVEDGRFPGGGGAWSAGSTSNNGAGLFSAVILDATLFSGSNSADFTLVKDFALYNTGTTGFTTDESSVPTTVQGGQNLVNVRRLNQAGTFTAGVFTPDPLVTTSTANAAVLMIISGVLNTTTEASLLGLGVSYTRPATLDAASDGSTLTIPTFESDFGTTPSPEIPEIDIKIESIAVTATTRKLRAKWSPELAQDLNAYHSLDAEVELTQILSEQIALEIDREILNDLLTQAKVARYWSRSPGKFMNKETGALVTPGGAGTIGPSFTGTVREWYETLIETIIDVANEIHRLTLRGSANFIVVSPDIATILEASVLYRPSYDLDGDGQVSTPFSLGAEKIGTLSNRFQVYKDPYFPRNKVLVGYKGGSYLETGYVYAPYVPLIVTPTIFAPEDFTPRKGVMTRYGKKMVRSDFYGTVTVADLNVI